MVVVVGWTFDFIFSQTPKLSLDIYGLQTYGFRLEIDIISIITAKQLEKKNLSSTKLISVLPLLVSIDSSPEPLTANMTNTVSCTSYGSNPPAVISWWLDGVRISNMESEVHCFSSLQIGNNF